MLLLGKLFALASSAARAGMNLGVGPAPTLPVDGDIWNTPAGMFARSNGASFNLGAAGLGSFTDYFTLATGQTTATLTHTPAGLADLTPSIGPLMVDPANLTGLVGKVVTFNAVPAAANGKILALSYTRLD